MVCTSLNRFANALVLVDQFISFYHTQDMLQNGGVREDPSSRGKVEVISQEEFETHKSRAAASSDDELQFSLDEAEEGSSDAPMQNLIGQPLVKLEPDAKSRFYPVPWKLPVMKDGKVCCIIPGLVE